ncbi:MAG TPA: AMP-dependent synthetase, partial [Cyanobacteria bacterium UBA11049]|nr:AMP-dependent synthetase [Cyanobacteria bacterium UBA11049]
MVTCPTYSTDIGHEVSTLVDLLGYRAQNQSDQTGYIFLQDGETEADRLTYQELDRQARAIASQLQSLDAVGSRALLLYPPGLEFVAAFFGCLYAGVVAVPAYPPRPNQNMSRLQAIVSDARAKVALTVTSILTRIEHQFDQNPELAAMHWLATDNIANDQAAAWQKPELSSDTLAFLQYT